MAVDHSRDTKRKKSGGRKRASKSKRRYNKGSVPTLTVIGEKKTKKKASKGNKLRTKTLKIQQANVMDPETHKSKKVKILSTEKNPANRNYPRRSILTKGAEIKTEAGTAVITSRPSKHGIVNAILVK